MCQQCTSIHPALEELVTKHTRTGIQDIVGRADRLLQVCNQMEDRYRDAGIAFHKTERAARHAWENDTGEWAHHYANLEKAFLLDRYEDIFAPLEDMTKRLTKLRTKAQHVPSAASASQLMVALRHELLPPMEALLTEFKTFKYFISRLKMDAHALRTFNRQFYQVNDLGIRCAWYDPVVDIINNKRTVRNRSGECTLFADWVYSLPEAQRALKVQAGLDGFNPSGSLFEDRLFAYSMDLLWRANEGLLPDGSQAIQGVQ
ncbi:hypothetical protein G6011_02781 [Alternaria panax]|uniref:Uncharacterized protein n=1 Tax=Alternaria panax TaxID=48097 RepID=A0AAD4I262_9PLEO|nr:hypothetical protein G6011_02781 [Alternaria panax]